MHTAMLKTIEEALIEAGHLALKNQQMATHEQKADKSIVTTGDLAVSTMLSEKLAPWLAQPGHVWIDEERLPLVGTPAAVLGGQYEYVWVSDPIDGTAPYANGRNTWGTILGVAKDGKPWIGGFSVPLQDKLFLTDGTTVWLITGAWGNTPQQKEIKLPERIIAGHSFFEIDRKNFGLYYQALQDDIWPHIPDSAASGQAYVAMGQSLGYSCHGFWSIWDITGAAAVMATLGMPYKNRKTGEVFTLKPENFNEKWKLQGDWLACNPALYTQLDALLKKAE
jgi:fructose-1,6-bisphosphatase/inositol monophosphatase family enzyme